MKNHSKKTAWRSLVSIFIFIVFLFFGLGSNSFFDIIGIPLATYSRYESKAEIYIEVTEGLSGESLDTFYQHQINGPKDEYGNWEGKVQIFTFNHWADENGESRHTGKDETVHIINGKRNGQSITKYYGFTPERPNDTVFYILGFRILDSKLKSALLNEEENTGFNVLQHYYPWFLSSLNVFGYTNEYVQSYMDTIEVLLNAESFDITKLDSRYDDAIEILEETQYDSLILLNSMVTSGYGKEQLKDLEFRMAVIDQQREKDEGTFYFLQSGYPHFLTSFNSETTIVKDSEWETFCSKFDSLMYTLSPLDIDDPFFVDSVDSRIYSTLAFISEEEEDTTKSATIKFVLKQAISNKKDISLSSLLEEHETNLFLQPAEDIPPQAFATAILIRMARKYLFEGDIPRLAVKEAYYLQQNIIQVPTLTTHLAASQSSSSATIEGNIIKDGGAEITDKGIVLATFLNPTTSDSIIKLQLEESFSITIDDLIEGKTYYVRSYATNTAGTAYGNNISFMAGNSVGLYQNKLSNSDFNIYPNPTTGNLSIRYFVSEDSKCEIRIFDIQGRQIAQPLFEFRTAGFHQIEFQYNEIPNGIYLIKFANNQESFTIKSILNK